MGVKAPSSLVVVVENAAQLIPLVDSLGQQFELAAGEHAHADLQIREKLAGPDLELHHGLQLVQTPMALNRVVHVFMESINRVIGGCDPLPEGQLTQGIHNSGDIDTIGALPRAGMASDADPDGITGHGFAPPSQLNQSDDLVGQQVHMRGKGTSAATGQTMPAHLNGLTGEVINNLDQIVLIHTIGRLFDTRGSVRSRRHFFLRCLFHPILYNQSNLSLI